MCQLRAEEHWCLPFYAICLDNGPEIWPRSLKYANFFMRSTSMVFVDYHQSVRSSLRLCSLRISFWFQNDVEWFLKWSFALNDHEIFSETEGAKILAFGRDLPSRSEVVFQYPGEAPERVHLWQLQNSESPPRIKDILRKSVMRTLVLVSF